MVASTDAACSPPMTEMRAFGQVNRNRGEKARPAHAVIAGAIGAADDQRDLRHRGAGDGGDQLGAVLGDAARLVAASDHEAGDVLQEEERDLPLAAELDEMRPLQRRFGKQDAVVGQDADAYALDGGEAGHQRLAVERLELRKFRAVDQAGDQRAHVVLAAKVDRHDFFQLGRRMQRLDRLADRQRRGRRRAEIGDDLADDRQSVAVVERIMIDDAGAAGMHLGAAELFRGDHLAGRRLHQRRAAEEDASPAPSR